MAMQNGKDTEAEARASLMTCTRRLRDLDGVARTKIAFTSDRDPAADDRPARTPVRARKSTSWTTTAPSVRRITVNKSLNIGPSWGPDGRTLA